MLINIRRILLWLIGLGQFCCVFHASAVTPSIKINGLAAYTGEIAIESNTRLNDILLKVQPSQNTYYLGAALLRENVIPQHMQLKQQLLNCIHNLQKNINHKTKPRNLPFALLQQLTEHLQTTGRVPAILDPDAVDITPALNIRLEPGDQLYFPQRPNFIRIVGAVEAAKKLSFNPNQPAYRYLEQAETLSNADNSLAWIIQPDGHIQTTGIAYWNRGSEILAPGATLYLPFSPSITKSCPDFNRDMTTLLAAQRLDESD